MKYSKQSIITTQHDFLIKTLNDQKKLLKLPVLQYLLEGFKMII